MKEGWEYRNFESCLVKVPKQVQVKSKDYKKEGRYPIVSQEAELISGYWDDETIVYKHKEPVVIFGDHTKNIKFIDFDFVVGADGTHILNTKTDINAKFFYYVLKNIKLRELGYARHYKLLKEKSIPVPPPSEQQSIVDYLDAAFDKIDAMKANAEKALNEAKALFQASLKEMLEPKEGWEYKKIKDVGSVIGGTTPNTNVAEYWNGTLCWISPAELDGSHYLYDSRKKITEAAVKAKSLKLLPVGTVILSSRAPIGKVVINKVPTYCNQGFKCVICGKEVYNEFLYWWLWGKTEFLNSLGTGATFKEISKKVVEEITIPVPPLSEQQSIVTTLDSLKSKVDKLQENYDKISQECDALKQAILRQVFE